MLWTNTGLHKCLKSVFEILISILLDVYPKVELLDPMLILILIFWELCHSSYHISCFSVLVFDTQFPKKKKNKWEGKSAGPFVTMKSFQLKEGACNNGERRGNSGYLPNFLSGDEVWSQYRSMIFGRHCPVHFCPSWLLQVVGRLIWNVWIIPATWLGGVLGATTELKTEID